MSEPTKIKAKLVDATYVKDARSVLLLLECDNGRFTAQMHRNKIATFGNRSEEEIEIEMNKYIEILKCSYIDKYITAIFDTELDGKIKDHYKLKY